MRATKTTIRFKLSRAEDVRALEYLRNQKAAGSSFSKSVVQAINDCLDAQAPMTVTVDAQLAQALSLARQALQ